MAEEELLAGLFDPLVRTTGSAALTAIGAMTVYLKLKGGPKPVEKAVNDLLPQAYHRAMLAAREGHRIVLKAIESATGIDAIKDRLKREGSSLTKEEKLSLWGEVMVQSYAVILVAPHILTTLVVALTIRSAASVLAHVRNSQGMGGIAQGLLGVVGGSEIAAALSKMVGRNAFALDDADDGLLIEGLADPSRSFFSKYDVIDILCERIPGLMHRARLCVMENIGMLPPTVSSVPGRSRYGGSSASTTTNGTASSSTPQDLHTLASKVPLDSLESALDASHDQFFEYILDWRADIFGSSDLLFSDRRSDRLSRSSDDPEDTEGDRESRRQMQTSPRVDSEEETTRKQVKGFVQDLLTSASVDELCRYLGATNAERWLDVCFFHCDTPYQTQQRQEDRLYQIMDAPSQDSAAQSGGWFGLGGGKEVGSVPFPPSSPYAERLERIRKSCTSFDLHAGGTVTLLQFVVALDKARQELLAEPFEMSASKNDRSQRLGPISIPPSVKEFCEELIRASA